MDGDFIAMKLNYRANDKSGENNCYAVVHDKTTIEISIVPQDLD